MNGEGNREIKWSIWHAFTSTIKCIAERKAVKMFLYCLDEGIVGDFCLFFYSVESPFSTLHTSFIIRKTKLYKEM